MENGKKTCVQIVIEIYFNLANNDSLLCFISKLTIIILYKIIQMKNKISKLFSTLLLILGVILNINTASAQAREDCLICHDDPSLISERTGKGMFINGSKIDHSVHKKVDCAECHKDALVEDYPHLEKLKKVDCGSCHKEAQRNFNRGAHGKKSKHSPSCKECHGGKHSVLSPSSPKSLTYKMNIPKLCGRCHKEGSPVSRSYNITEHNIVDNYSQGIHGKGLFERGLIVTATCNNCHGNHLVLPSFDSRSAVSSKNIANTCMQCHVKIEDTHKKVIQGKLWEDKPGDIPSCKICHPPHKENRKQVPVRITDQACLDCHEKADIYKIEDGKKISVQIDPVDLSSHMHKNIPCTKCHTTVTLTMDRPCETIEKVDCSTCHAEVSDIYFESAHGQAYSKNDENAPYCTDCHNFHKVKSKDDATSPVYRTAIPKLCGECHTKDSKLSKNKDFENIDALHDYSSSVHGKALTDKGLLVTAICTDCHTTHFMMKSTDERSSIYPSNVPKTCAQCHEGIYNKYINSDHSIIKSDGEKKFPNCSDCHSSHTISDINQDNFMYEMTNQCGSCHEDLAATYLDTYHGKAYQLGDHKSAKCSDCHGAHNILKKSNPNSMVGSKNLVATCAQCHEGANENFSAYLSHATHNDNPILFYTFWTMTSLLIGVFGFFGLHTLLWLPRSLKQRKKHKKVDRTKEVEYIRRFSPIQSVTHIFIIVSFVFLSLTGMTLKFADQEWAKFMMTLFGGVANAGVIHRIGAVITFGYFAFHVYNLLKIKRRNKQSFMKFAFGRDSLMFNKQDITDFIATIKWFVGKGPRPQYGRWTYWEKFDYMAVFWGVAVIGFSGLILWFPVFFTKFFPGWVINVAQIIHSDEALLAVGFIFTIHFFNTHFRPEAFPMDTVIFTGHMPLEEFKEDRPREYKELKEEGRLDKIVSKRKYSNRKMLLIKAFGFTALTIGICMVILIAYSLLA